MKHELVAPASIASTSLAVAAEDAGAIFDHLDDVYRGESPRSEQRYNTWPAR